MSYVFDSMLTYRYKGKAGQAMLLTGGQDRITHAPNIVVLPT
jgi:hypothetical protein